MKQGRNRAPGATSNRRNIGNCPACSKGVVMPGLLMTSGVFLLAASLMVGCKDPVPTTQPGTGLSLSRNETQAIPVNSVEGGSLRGAAAGKAIPRQNAETANSMGGAIPDVGSAVFSPGG